MKPLCALWVLCIVLAGCFASPTAPHPTSTPDPFPALLAEGEMLAARDERTAAEESFLEAAAFRPSDPAPYLRLARLYRDWNRPQEGLTAVAAAERLGAPAGEVASLRTALHAARRDWEAVLSDGALALQLNPADASIRHLVAQACVELGRVDEARTHYQALLALVLDDPLAHERLGALLALSDPAAARPHLEAAATPLASDLLGALAAGGNDPTYRLARVGMACLAHGEAALAGLALQQAVARNPAYADGHALLGQALEQTGQMEEAQDHVEQAVRLAPNSALARSLLGLHYLQAGEPEKARPHLEAAYDLDPQNPALSLYLARLYADLGLYSAAEVWLEEAIRLAPEDPVIGEQVARFYLDRSIAGGQRALEVSRELVQRAPESGAAHELLGQAWFMLGHYAEAETELLKAVEMEPERTSAWYHLGQLYAYLGRGEEARGALIAARDRCLDPALWAEIEQALAELP